MRNLKVLPIALLIATSSLFATEIVPDIPVKEIRSQVADLFKTPDFKIAEETTVTILFTFSSGGDIVVLKIGSKDPDILEYVRKSMSHKTIQTPGEENRVFTMPLRITN